MIQETQEAQWLSAAAKGDCGALTALTHFCIANVAGGVPTFEALAMAEPFARLAAEAGGPMCKLLLADVLIMRSVGLREAGNEARAEAHRESSFALYDEAAQSDDPAVVAALVACLTALADSDEAAAVRLNKVIARLPHEEALAARESAKRRLQNTTEYWSELASIAASASEGE